MAVCSHSQKRALSSLQVSLNKSLVPPLVFNLPSVKVHLISSHPDSLSQGSRLLLPHISTLLGYLSGVVRNSDRLKRKKFRVQVAKELNILSKSVKALDALLSVSSGDFVETPLVVVFRISRFVSEKEQCSVLISLLLPYLQRAKNPQVGHDNKVFIQRYVARVPSLADVIKPLVISGDGNRHPGHGPEPAETERGAIRLPAAAQQTLLRHPQQAAQTGPDQHLPGTTGNETEALFLIYSV